MKENAFTMTGRAAACGFQAYGQPLKKLLDMFFKKG